MKKIIIALVIFSSVLVVFTGCAASHANLGGGSGGSTSQHSGGCH